MTDSISEIQAARRRAERDPIDWPTMRAALIESGMVEERRWAQSEVEDIPAFLRVGSEVRLDLGRVPLSYLEHLRVAEATLIDELYDEKHGTS